jgi:formylglycine-generating enzyme required for sulfatase activity
VSRLSPAEPTANTVISRQDQAEMLLIPADGPSEYGIDQSRMKRIVRKLRERVQKFFLDESPRKKTELKAYYIDRFEVTNAQYGRFLAANPKHGKPKYSTYPQYNGPNLPVVGISWNDARAYAQWAGKRLPTEEEWEKAARGKDGRDWPWGNEPGENLFNGRELGRFLPMPVGSFPKGNSPYGLSDMAGNVWEMTSTAWDKDSHVIRGGSFLNTHAEVRTTVRWAASESNERGGAPWLGFRCVMELDAARTQAQPK